VVAALAARAAGPAGCGNHGDLSAGEIGRQLRQTSVVTIGPAVDDQDTLTLDIAALS
jgi:hypothetical protein